MRVKYVGVWNQIKITTAAGVSATKSTARMARWTVKGGAFSLSASSSCSSAQSCDLNDACARRVEDEWQVSVLFHASWLFQQLHARVERNEPPKALLKLAMSYQILVFIWPHLFARELEKLKAIAWISFQSSSQRFKWMGSWGDEKLKKISEGAYHRWVQARWFPL